MEDTKVTLDNRTLADTVDGLEKSFIIEQNGANDMAFSALKKVEDWDNTPVPTAEIQPAESFVIPIDSPEGKLKSTNRQANTYAAKKTVAQGMMDIALITANANQLRYIVEFTSHTKTYYFNLVLIILSLILQVMVGLVLIFKGRLDLRGESKMRNAPSFTITGNNNSGFQNQYPPPPPFMANPGTNLITKDANGNMLL
ncbi:Ninjurin B [Carabus blaptoides fortunei]